MSKDYKQSGKRPAAGAGKRGGGGSGGSIFAGLFIGLCLGIAIAVAAALYLNKSPNPFGSRVSKAGAAAQPSPGQPEVLAPTGGGKAPIAVPPLPPASDPATPAKPAPDRFDFYTMLPELGGDAKPEPKAVVPSKPPEANPPATVQPAKGSYLQAGAFQNETDADNLKAKLALLGIEANIQTSEVAGKGVLHRVRIGPLARLEDIDRLRSQLSVNGVDSALIKQ
ncbi:SPOR domain-containing protein [Chitinimonas arctica]|uniref:SPOR domain-containing protein n=1 Tax=Chitinimonas arctica TaxID=2594795 RepID=A0A516SF41_9NEIS|nr:SPOR domain-containing protein [Chitinimonas arctica]QDQ26779.1 SPOR domain-containing protein [Chitinimonas arctica]